MKKNLTNAGRVSLVIMLFSILTISFGMMSCSEDAIANLLSGSPGTITVSAAGITDQSSDKVLVITAANPTNLDA